MVWGARCRAIAGRAGGRITAASRQRRACDRCGREGRRRPGEVRGAPCRESCFPSQDVSTDIAHDARRWPVACGGRSHLAEPLDLGASRSCCDRSVAPGCTPTQRPDAGRRTVLLDVRTTRQARPSRQGRDVGHKRTTQTATISTLPADTPFRGLRALPAPLCWDDRHPLMFSEVHDEMFEFLGENTIRNVCDGAAASCGRFMRVRPSRDAGRLSTVCQVPSALRRCTRTLPGSAVWRIRRDVPSWRSDVLPAR